MRIVFQAATLVAILCCSNLAWSQEQWIPHITPTNNFITSIQIQNNQYLTGFVELTAYDSDGNFLTTETVVLPAFQGISVSDVELFGQTVSHFSVSGDTEFVQVTVNYAATTPDATPANVGVQPVGDLWNFYPGNWTTAFDALAVVNTSPDLPATFELAQWTEDDFLIEAQDFGPIPPNGKLLLVVSNSGFDPVADSYFQLDSDQDVTLVALRGNADSTFLWANNTIVIESAQLSLTRRFLGYWLFDGLDEPFMAAYNMSSIDRRPNENGDYFIYGTDMEGNLDVFGGFDNTSETWLILDLTDGDTHNLLQFVVDGDLLFEVCQYEVNNDLEILTECNTTTAFRRAFPADNPVFGKANPPANTPKATGSMNLSAESKAFLREGRKRLTQKQAQLADQK